MTTPGVPLRARLPVAGAALVCLASALTACSLGSGSGTPAPVPPSEPPSPPTLEARAGAVVEAQLAPGERHVFPLDLDEGTYVEVHVDRPTEVIRSHLFHPGVDPLADSGEPYVSGERSVGRPGQVLWEVMQHTGRHHLRVDRRAGADPVAYRLEIVHLRPANDRDRHRFDGMRLYDLGKELEGQEDALEQYVAAREHFEAGEYELGVVTMYRLEGALCSSLGQRDRARRAYEHMADRARGYGILNSEILALTELAGLEADAIEWERAHGYLATARRRSREENDRQMETMVDDHSCRVYQKQGEMQRAFESCLASLRAREELGLETEMVSTLVSLGQILSDRGEIAESRRHYLRALEIFGRYPDAEREAVIHNDLALLYRDEGRYQEAVASFERSLESYGDHYDVTKPARVLYNMGGTYERLGETDRALELYRRAVGWMDQAGDLTGRIELRGSLAWALREEGHREEGRRVLAELSSLTQDIDSNPLLARTLEMIGDFQLEDDEPGEALESLRTARRLYEEMDRHLEVPNLLRKIADALRALGELETSLGILREAISLDEKIDKPSGVAASHYRIALVERRRGNPGAAREAIETALAKVEEVRDVAGAEEVQALYSATVQPYHELRIDLLMAEHERRSDAGFDALALEQSERWKAQSLREIIAGGDLGVDADVSEELRRNRDRWRTELEDAARARRLLQNGPGATDEERFRVQRRLDRASTELQEVESRMRATSPRYADLTDPEPISLAQIQKDLLDPETALLEYSLGEERSFLWLVTRATFRTYVLPERASIEAQAQCVHRLITAYGTVPAPEDLDPILERCLGTNLEPYRDIAAQGFGAYGRRRREIRSAFDRVGAALSDTILGGPARDGLLPLRMAVVSDGALEYVPFAALPAPDDPARALVDGHEIVRLPSASILAVQRERGRDPMARADGLVAIVADPVYSADDRRVSGRPEGEQSTEERLRSFAIPPLRRLEHSGDEARTIASLVPGERTLVLAGFDANRSRVLESDLGSYLYVHFAAHGMIDTEYPKVSSLVLSQVDESGRAEEDGYLRLHDIYGMELDDVDMVVLSACETALGKEVRGEGLMGLTRGFLYAGSRRVAASLWQVQDDKTEELMEHFYRGLFEEDRAPAEALRHAQIAVRDSEEGDYSFPYYWAGFVLQGEWR